MIAPSSSFRYAPDGTELRQIRRDLGAAYVLRGSVRHSAERLRVTAQLKDARNLATLWMDRYDRPGTELPAIPDQVAEQVAVQLVGHAREGAARNLRGRPTASLEADELLLSGHKAHRSFTREGAMEARAAAERAIAFRDGLAFTNSSSCFPGGFPASLCRDRDWFWSRTSPGSMYELPSPASDLSMRR